MYRQTIEAPFQAFVCAVPQQTTGVTVETFLCLIAGCFAPESLSCTGRGRRCC